MLLPLFRHVIGNVLSPAGKRARLSILIYHHVLEQPDPVFPEDLDGAGFDLQMRTLAQCCNVLPLSEAAERLAHGALPARAACVTFDDGYENNVSVALPIAENTSEKPESQGQTVVAIAPNKTMYVNARPVLESELGLRVTELLELCQRIQAILPSFVFVESEVGKDPDKRDYIVSNEKVEATGFQPAFPLDDGIRELVKGFTMLRARRYANA